MEESINKQTSPVNIDSYAKRWNRTWWSLDRFLKIISNSGQALFIWKFQF